MIESPPYIANHRILVIDDNPDIHQDFDKILRGEADSTAALSSAELLLFGESPTTPARPVFDVEFASQGEQGVALARTAAASGRPFAMAFVDMRMPPGWDGLETIERLWAVDPDIQVVICSAHSDYDWGDFVSRLGISHKLLVLKKPFEPIEVMQCASALTRKWQHERVLYSQMESLERVVTARTEGLEAANRQLRHLATHDTLTGLPNRVLLDDRLAQAIAHAHREQQQFAVLVVDLDRFKLVNDSLGHRAGDELLCEVARRLCTLVRDIDTVTRLGGDEFVLVLSPVTSAQDAERVATRVVESLESPVKIAGMDVYTSPSIGIALYPADGATTETLLTHADAAMYCAKQQGRNRFQCFASGMDTVTRDRVQLEGDLRQALALNQFEIYYQPKVDATTGKVHGAEALIRWHHPERGLVMPADFIPLAEECGLIHSIGDWVIREACRQCKAWQIEGLLPLRVAVNVAAAQFRNGTLLDTIQRALQDAGLEPRCLELELTESAVMTNPEESVAILENLSRMGVVVSVDDFGTGYSSMSYLRRFPIDKLKIDRGFIRDLVTRPDDVSIVQAIISLAHSLKLKVIAEGVETPEQLGFLRSMGCDQYQGFHFSPPLPAAAFKDLVQELQDSLVPFAGDQAATTHSKLAVYRDIGAR
ncbi:MAG: EAL domain-containing protein [Steroidobacteraceae bacterium]